MRKLVFVEVVYAGHEYSVANEVVRPVNGFQVFTMTEDNTEWSKVKEYENTYFDSLTDAMNAAKKFVDQHPDYKLVK